MKTLIQDIEVVACLAEYQIYDCSQFLAQQFFMSSFIHRCLSAKIFFQTKLVYLPFGLTLFGNLSRSILVQIKTTTSATVYGLVVSLALRRWRKCPVVKKMKFVAFVHFLTVEFWQLGWGSRQFLLHICSLDVFLGISSGYGFGGVWFGAGASGVRGRGNEGLGCKYLGL